MYRLHTLYQKCHLYSEKGDLTKLKWSLDRIWIELVNDAKKLDGKEIEKNLYFKKIKNLNESIAKVQTDSTRFYQALLEKEIFLKFLQDDAGKSGRYSDKDEETFD